jgi:hypothetical protein
VREETGRDPHLGHYVLIALEWRPSTEATVIFETTVPNPHNPFFALFLIVLFCFLLFGFGAFQFKLFTDTSVVIFGQRFPNGTTSNGTDNQEAFTSMPL